jgi:hypothetical protein
MADLEQICQASEPSCRITRADIGPAVGWVSSYRSGDAFAGSTLILVRDGNLMTVRSIAPTSEAARQNIRRLQREVLPRIIGR